MRDKSTGVRGFRISVTNASLYSIALLSLVYGALHFYFGVLSQQSNYNKDIADDVILYLAVSAGIIAVLKAGHLSKAKFGGAEFEFAAATEKLHKDGAEIKKLGVELSALKRRLSADESPPATLSPSSDGFKSPGAITVKGDQQKGRFGGKAASEGYELDVVFHSARNAKIVNLDLIVRRTDGTPMTQNVRFYLHESFEPDEIVVTPEDGRAVLDILCYGGFTAGAAIGETGVLLELDLSTLPKAPRIIREQ